MKKVGDINCSNVLIVHSLVFFSPMWIRALSIGEVSEVFLLAVGHASFNPDAPVCPPHSGSAKGL